MKIKQSYLDWEKKQFDYKIKHKWLKQDLQRVEKEFTQVKKKLICFQEKYQSMLTTHKQKQDLQHQLNTTVKELKAMTSHNHAKGKKIQKQRD